MAVQWMREGAPFVIMVAKQNPPPIKVEASNPAPQFFSWAPPQGRVGSQWCNRLPPLGLGGRFRFGKGEAIPGGATPVNSRGTTAVAVVAVVGAVLLALLVRGVGSAGGGYPLYVALAALGVVVVAALGVVLALFLLVRRWL